MAFDITQLSPADIESIAALIKNGGTRSPIWKPLRDMRAPQTAKGRLNRPHFEWSADEPPEGVMIKPYPRLVWDAHGIEKRVESPEAFAALGEGYTFAPPMAKSLSTMDRVQEELASLSEADRKFVLDAQREARLNRLKDAMSGLSAADIASLTPSVPAVVTPIAPKAKSA